MTEYNFTAADVVTEVRKLAAERPDFTYAEQPERLLCMVGAGGNYMPGCSYVGAVVGEDGGEGCIVGQALARLGVSHYDLLFNEGESAGEVLSVLGIAGGSSWLDEVQSTQDMGRTWGEAVTTADG